MNIYSIAYNTSQQSVCKAEAEWKSDKGGRDGQTSSNATKLQLNHKKVNDHHTHISQIYNTLARCSSYFKLRFTISFIQFKVGAGGYDGSSSSSNGKQFLIIIWIRWQIDARHSFLWYCSPAFLNWTLLLSTKINYYNYYYCSLFFFIMTKYFVLLNMCFSLSAVFPYLSQRVAILMMIRVIFNNQMTK